jgi:hypothetical protein
MVPPLGQDGRPVWPQPPLATWERGGCVGVGDVYDSAAACLNAHNECVEQASRVLSELDKGSAARVPGKQFSTDDIASAVQEARGAWLQALRARCIASNDSRLPQH